MAAVSVGRMSCLGSLAATGEAKPMRFSQKVRKLETGQAFESAARHLRRATFSRRFGLSLDPERLIKSIDKEIFEAIRQRYASDNLGEGWPKYLNLPLWMTKNLRRVRELRLDWGARQRILDLGCGAGYFLYICQWLGHDVLGLDIDTVPNDRGNDRARWADARDLPGATFPSPAALKERNSILSPLS